ncbi:MAG: esterase-like activity of phytase family protein [Chitinophagaceae bacterium]|nr:MAG: esterase-like activity of phytase family protein [Chitinophagaceae bacterium]
MMKRYIVSIISSVFLFSCASQKLSQQKTIKQLGLIDEYILPNNTQFKGTTVGGLSSIDYSPEENLFYFICDDRSDINPIRFYTAKIVLNTKGFENIELVNVTNLLEPNGQPFHNRKQDPLGVPDPEAMRYNPETKTFIWSSEGERTVRANQAFLTNPTVYIANKNGQYIDTFSLPLNLHIKATEEGPRNNGVFEGVALSTDNKKLFVSVEEPLYEDGHRAGVNDSSGWVRFIQYDIETKQPIAQYAYQIDPVVQEPIPKGAFKVNGVTDILTVNDHQLLVTERSYSAGRISNNIRTYLAEMNGAENIASNRSLKNNLAKKPLQKKLLLNMDDLSKPVYNIEGATLGPVLPNGKQSLIFVSDNNFADDQRTQFLLFEID